MARAFAAAAVAACVKTGVLGIKAPPKEFKEDCIVSTGMWWLDEKDALGNPVNDGPRNFSATGKDVIKHLGGNLMAYGDEYSVKGMKLMREGVRKHLVVAENLPIDMFPPCVGHGKSIKKRHSSYIHPPLINSTKLGCIRNAKFFIMRKTMMNDPFHAWYSWMNIDTEMSEGTTWPNPSKLSWLPVDKISATTTYPCSTCKKGDWTTVCHCIASSPLVVNKELVVEANALFYDKLEECMKAADDRRGDGGYICMDDRVIMTQMELSRPGLFNLVGSGLPAPADATMAFFSTDAPPRAHNGLYDFLAQADDAPPTILAFGGRQPETVLDSA